MVVKGLNIDFSPYLSYVGHLLIAPYITLCKLLGVKECTFLISWYCQHYRNLHLVSCCVTVDTNKQQYNRTSSDSCVELSVVYRSGLN